jgi:hypothetical protein
VSSRSSCGVEIRPASLVPDRAPCGGKKRSLNEERSAAQPVPSRVRADPPLPVPSQHVPYAQRRWRARRAILLHPRSVSLGTPEAQHDDLDIGGNAEEEPVMNSPNVSPGWYSSARARRPVARRDRRCAARSVRLTASRW